MSEPARKERHSSERLFTEHASGEVARRVLSLGFLSGKSCCKILARDSFASAVFLTFSLPLGTIFGS